MNALAKRVVLIAFATLTACDLPQHPIPAPHEASVGDFDPQYIECAEFDRHTKRNGERWTCRILYCHRTVNSGAGVPLWCEPDKEATRD